MKRTHTGGFTLLELLVAMAVIAILTAGVLAGLGSVRRSMMNAKAQAQAKQTANAFIAYYNAYGRWPDTTTSGTLTWTPHLRVLTGENYNNGNPKKIIFLEMERTWTNSNCLVDPWQNAFLFQVAPNGMNAGVADPFGGSSALNTPVAIWSAGPDKQLSTVADNPRNW